MISIRQKIISIARKVLFPETYCEEAYINALRNKYHVDIGKKCRIYSPNQTYIDKQRGHMLHIGDYCKITRNVTILTHDYSRGVCCNISEGDFGNVGEAALTYIGNNVFLGVNSTILMGSYIGDNSIVGAGAVVSGRFPKNVVIAGNPAKIVCSIEEYFRKRKDREIEAAREYVKCWRSTYNREPSICDMTNAFSWLYLPHTQESVDKFPDFFDLGGVDRDILIYRFLESKPQFDSFEEFLQSCND